MTTNEEMNCPICLEPIEKHIDCLTTRCKHTFHTSCYLKIKKFTSCPVCRTVIVDSLSNDTLIRTIVDSPTGENVAVQQHIDWEELELELLGQRRHRNPIYVLRRLYQWFK